MQVNQIHLGNCLDYLRDPQEFPDQTIDCVITSPPYFQQRGYNQVGTIGTETAVAEYLASLLTVFEQCYRVIKPEGSLVFNLGDKYDDGHLQLIPFQFALAVRQRYGSDIRLVNELTWIKTNPTPRQDPSKLIAATEPFFIFAKSKRQYFDKTAFLAADTRKTQAIGPTFGQSYHAVIAQAELTAAEKAQAHMDLDAAIRDVRDGEIVGIRMKIRGVHALAYGGLDGGRNRQIANKGYTIIRLKGEMMKRDWIEQPVETIKGNKHPAVYPTKLIEELIKLLVPSDGIILDPFLGSGTTAVAAKNTGRKYIGMEIDPAYFDYASLRLQEPMTFADEFITLESVPG